MYAVIRNENGADKLLRTCITKEAVIIAAQLEKNNVSPNERSRIRAVAMDDEGYSEIMM